MQTPCADYARAGRRGGQVDHAGATARNGRGGARGADHRRREAGADVPSRAGRADHRPCRGPALRREAGARGAMPIIQGHALASWCRSSTLPEAVPSCPSSTAVDAGAAFPRSREGRARQYESIILRNWPECGHRRRLNCSTFTAGGGAGAWVLPPSFHLLTATGRGKESQLRAQIRRPPPWWAGRSSRATARNGRGGARGADHRRREAGADVPSRAGRADHRPCRGAALRREAGARGAMPIIQGHALASWCRSSTLPEAGPSCPSTTAADAGAAFPRSREGRARQYESIILRNWPECGHRRRLNCSTFTAGGGAGAWVLPPSFPC